MKSTRRTVLTGSAALLLGGHLSPAAAPAIAAQDAEPVDAWFDNELDSGRTVTFSGALQANAHDLRGAGRFGARVIYLLGHRDGTGELVMQGIADADTPFQNGFTIPVDGPMVAFDVRTAQGRPLRRSGNVHRSDRATRLIRGLIGRLRPAWTFWAGLPHGNTPDEYEAVDGHLPSINRGTLRPPAVR